MQLLNLFKHAGRLVWGMSLFLILAGHASATENNFGLDMKGDADVQVFAYGQSNVKYFQEIFAMAKEKMARYPEVPLKKGVLLHAEKDLKKHLLTQELFCKSQEVLFKEMEERKAKSTLKMAYTTDELLGLISFPVGKKDVDGHLELDSDVEWIFAVADRRTSKNVIKGMIKEQVASEGLAIRLLYPILQPFILHMATDMIDEMKAASICTYWVTASDLSAEEKKRIIGEIESKAVANAEERAKEAEDELVSSLKKDGSS